MIVVVGIIAVLAAVIVPNIGRFIGSGEEGAKDAERQAVQTAMHAMMADRAIDEVDPSVNSSVPLKTWAALPTDPSGDSCPLGEPNPAVAGCPAAGYLQGPDTSYYYCYNTQGLITLQVEASELATETCPILP
jgi:type II secretory pathway pseudopilin PulG